MRVDRRYRPTVDRLESIVSLSMFFTKQPPSYLQGSPITEPVNDQTGTVGAPTGALVPSGDQYPLGAAALAAHSLQF